MLALKALLKSEIRRMGFQVVLNRLECRRNIIKSYEIDFQNINNTTWQNLIRLIENLLKNLNLILKIA